MLEGLLEKNPINSFLVINCVQTLLVIVIFSVIHFFIARWLRNAKFNWTPEQRLKIINNVKSVIVSLVFFTLLYIWSKELSALIFSIVGVAMAIVIATKELLLCVSGSTLRFRNNSYQLGDRIEIMGYRGDVIKMNLLSTTMLEVAPNYQSVQQTGRLVSFPNSLLVSSFVINESIIPGYIIGKMKIPLRQGEDWEKAKRQLLEISEEECAPFMKEVNLLSSKFERREGIEMPSCAPKVVIVFSDNDKFFVFLILTYPSPTYMKSKLEEIITNRFIKEFYQ